MALYVGNVSLTDTGNIGYELPLTMEQLQSLVLNRSHDLISGTDACTLLHGWCSCASGLKLREWGVNLYISYPEDDAVGKICFNSIIGELMITILQEKVCEQALKFNMWVRENNPQAGKFVSFMMNSSRKDILKDEFAVLSNSQLSDFIYLFIGKRRKDKSRVCKENTKE